MSFQKVVKHYTQIFKQSVEISGSQLTRELENAMIGIELNGTPEDRTLRKAEIQGEILAREELKKLNVMAGEMENALIFGKAYMNGTERYGFRTVSFQKVVKLGGLVRMRTYSFRTVSFQKVVKHDVSERTVQRSFRTVSFQKVVKL